MKVYVLLDHLEYDGPATVYGVFSTEEKAQRQLKRLAEDEYSEKFYVVDCLDVDDSSLIDKWLEEVENGKEYWLKYNKEHGAY